jgi:hypothetical protein
MKIKSGLIIVVLMVVGLVPTASAGDTPKIMITNPFWLEPCGADFGEIGGDMIFNVPAGYIWGMEFSAGDNEGHSETGSIEIPVPEDVVFSETGTDIFPVPSQGWIQITFIVYSPDHVYISSTSVYGNCITGQVYALYGDAASEKEPPADKRVMGTVLVDTPLYGMADPGTALSATLKAGQTWFVVGQATGTDGAVWYKVYVASPGYAYVPASAMSLAGPIP